MKIPLSWISLYSPVTSLFEKYTPKELAHEYSIHTAEIDGIEEHFLDKVVVGRVISCERHPESKKLSIVEVEMGALGTTTILTGAENIKDAHYVAVAMVGAVLPGDFVIGERMMAGMMSRGMICSDDELGLASERAEGILILETIWEEPVLETMLGTSFFDLTLPFPGKNGEVYHYPLRDTTFEIDNKFITNRPDLFSVVGNAREFHAVFGTTFTPYTHITIETKDTLSVEISADDVSSYHLMAIDDITPSHSPYGISIMMERAGQAPKLDLIDTTNLIMTELGQPMHVYDADTITGKMSVRMARAGEVLDALDGKTYTLTDADIVIADEVGPLALAGIIGGVRSSVTEKTTRVIYESACFDATTIRLSAQRHGVRTDSSTRYEKSLDPVLAGTTFGRVVEYLRFLGKNPTPKSTYNYVNTIKVHHIELEIDYAFLEKKAGIPLAKSRIDSILRSLGFGVADKGAHMVVTVPSHRASKDISIQEDIAEEIIRVIGYENIPPATLPTSSPIITKNIDTILRDHTLSYFRSSYWNEVYTYSFTNESLDKSIFFKDMSDAVSIKNAFNEEYTHMRRSLAPRLLLAASENIKHHTEFHFFEIGKVYSKNMHQDKNNTLLQNIAIKPFPEKKVIAGVSIGTTLTQIRETLESYMIDILGYTPPVHSGTHLAFFHPGISGEYREDNLTIASFGKVHPETISAFGLPSDTFYFEMDFDTIKQHYIDKDTRFHPISRYQTIQRELNFLADSRTPTGDIAHIINAVHPWIDDVIVDSIYEDEMKIGSGKKSVNFSFVLSNHEATISDGEALEVQNMVIETLAKHGYELRSV